MTHTLHCPAHSELMGALAEADAFIESMADGSGGRFHASDIEMAILRGDMKLWLVRDDVSVCAAVVTQTIDYPRVKAWRLIGAAGRHMPLWIDLYWQLESAARKDGARLVEALCRPGWSRVLARFGFRLFHVLVERAI